MSLSLASSIGRLLPDRARVALRRWRYAIRNRGFEPYVTPIDRLGEHFQFYIGDAFGEAWFKMGWEWTEIEYMKGLVRPGDVVLECGAHHGELTLFLSRWVGSSGRILSFEPVAANQAIVRENLELNDVTNVELVPKAVGSKRSSMTITAESNAQIVSGKGTGVEVEVVPLDDYAAHQPTFLKIDVEGFELEVLRGASRVLEARPRIAMEIHPNAIPRYGGSTAELVRMLRELGYSLFVHERGTGQVVAFRGSDLEAGHLFAVPNGD